jgi:hypothetical protein
MAVEALKAKRKKEEKNLSPRNRKACHSVSTARLLKSTSAQYNHITPSHHSCCAGMPSCSYWGVGFIPLFAWWPPLLFPVTFFCSSLFSYFCLVASAAFSFIFISTLHHA